MFDEQIDILDENIDISEMFEHFRTFSTVSVFFRKCFPVCQEVVGIKKRPEFKVKISVIYVFVKHVTILRLKPI